MLFYPPNQTNRVCFWQETAAKTKRFSCLDQQGKEEKDSVEKKGGKKSLVPTHESRKILKTFNSRSRHRDWGLFLYMPLVTSCIVMQKWFRFVRQSCFRDWLLLNTKQLGNRSVCSFLEASLKSDVQVNSIATHTGPFRKTHLLSQPESWYRTNVLKLLCTFCLCEKSQSFLRQTDPANVHHRNHHVLAQPELRFSLGGWFKW